MKEDIKLVLEQMQGVVNREIPLLVLAPEYTKILLDYITQLENNWKELKKYIGKEWYCFDNESVEVEVSKDILDKMQEIESDDNEKDS